MNGKPIPRLIDVPEAVTLSMKYSTTGSAYTAKEIADEYERACSEQHRGPHSIAWMYAAIFDAGRIQGIREERSRRREGSRP